VSTAGNVNESATISGLQPQTTYHYRMRLTNLDGTYTGADGTFTTSSPATAPTIGSSSSGSVGTSSAKLYAGNVNAGSSATTLVFDYGLSTAYGSLISWPLSIPTQSTVGSANVTVTGLLPSTTYHYRVAAINGQGTTYTADNTFTTAGVPTIVTGTVSAQDVTALTSGSANANGGTLTLYYDYGSTTAYGQLAAASPSSVSGSSSTSVTGSLTGLTPSTTLHYRLKALDAAGIYWYGADMTSSTTAPSSAPAVLTGTASPSATSAWLSATNISAGGAPATLSWSYGLTTAYGSSLAYSPVFPLGTTSYGVTGNITGLTPSTTYHFQAVITSALGTNYGGDATFTTPAISVTATTLPATGIRSTTATLNGSYINTASSSTLTFNFGPTISYGTSVAAVPVNISTGSVNAVLTNLTPGATYHYQLVNSPPGGTAYGADMTFAALATNAAVAITGTATGSSNGSATFQGTVNAVSGTAAAVIEYGLTTDYGYVVPAVPDPVTGSLDTAVGATATGLTNYSTYHYRVDATNSQGTTYGSDATVQIYPPPSIEYLPVDVNAQSATLSAFVSGSGYIPDGSYFEYGTTTSYGTILPIYNGISYMLAQAGGIDGWNFPFPNNPYLKPGTTYHYNLVVTGAGGTTYGSDMTFTTDYPAPSVAYPAVSAVTSTSATLNATVTETGGTDTVGFYYGLTSGHGATVNAAPGTASGNGSFPVSATLTDLQPGTTYHYQAWAFHLVNGNEVSFAFADQSFTTLSNVQSWRQQYFGTTAESGAMADSASYANDGVANLLKYALGLDPTVPGANLLPTAILKNYNGVTYLSYTFPRDPTKTDLTYQVVSASNPGGPWTAIATSAGGAATTGPGFVAETPGTGNLINVEVHDTVPTTAATARFLQLVVTDSTE
jgi:phosphodiesterase/alkaline phosphatase D-like protein